MKGNRIQKAAKDTLVSVIILSAIAIIVFILNHRTPLFADDYAYSCIFGTKGQRLTSFSEIFVSQYSHYLGVNGRTVTHFLAQLFLLIGKPAFSIINTAVFVALGLVIYYHAYLSFTDLKPLPLAFIFLSLFLFIPAFGQSFLWVTGSANYLYGPFITLLFLIPYRKALAKNDRRSVTASILLALCMFFLGAMAGNVNENNGVLAVLVAWCFLIATMIRRKALSPWHITSALGTVIGCCFMLLSPGTHSRLGEEGFSFSLLPFRLRTMTFDIIERYAVLFLTVLSLFIILFLYFKKRKNYSTLKTISELRLPILYFLLFALSFYALAIPPYFAYRVWSTFTVFLIIAILNLFSIVESELFCSEDSLPVQRIIACICLIIILAIAGKNYPTIRSIDYQYKQRLSIIYQAKENDLTTVTLPAISSSNRFSCFESDGDIKADETAWQNRLMARYFKFESINAISED